MLAAGISSPEVAAAGSSPAADSNRSVARLVGRYRTREPGAEAAERNRSTGPAAAERKRADRSPVEDHNPVRRRKAADTPAERQGPGSNSGRSTASSACTSASPGCNTVGIEHRRVLDRRPGKARCRSASSTPERRRKVNRGSNRRRSNRPCRARNRCTSCCRNLPG